MTGAGWVTFLSRLTGGTYDNGASFRGTWCQGRSSDGWRRLVDGELRDPLSDSVVSRMRQRRVIADSEVRVVRAWADGVCRAYEDAITARLNDSKMTAIVQCMDAYLTNSERSPSSESFLRQQRDRAISKILSNQ